MPQLHAPDLLRKFHLLVSHAGYKNVAEIAAEIDVNPFTLRSWTKDHVKRDAGTVSKHGREKVIGLFCAHLPHLSEQAVIDLLEGPYDDMAFVFFSKRMFGLSALIDGEADFKGAKVYIEQDETSEAAQKGRLLRQRKHKRPGDTNRDDLLRQGGVVTIKLRQKVDPTEFIPMGTDFRIEFPIARRAKYFLGIQESSQGWAAIPTAPAKGGKVVHMPEPDDQGEPVMMCEDHDHGPSRFSLIQSMQPFPESIYASLLDSIRLSRTDIGFLIRHLRDLPKADRTIQAVDIEFFEL